MKHDAFISCHTLRKTLKMWFSPLYFAFITFLITAPKQQCWFLHFPAFLSQTGPHTCCRYAAQNRGNAARSGLRNRVGASWIDKKFYFLTCFICNRDFVPLLTFVCEGTCSCHGDGLWRCFRKEAMGDQCCASLIWALCSSMVAATPPPPPHNQNKNQ